MPKSAQKVLDIVFDGRLSGNLISATSDRTRLRIKKGRQNRGENITAHCCDFLLSAKQDFTNVVAGRSRPTSFDSWISQEFRPSSNALRPHPERN
jgi:hypothetical protein